MLVKSRSSSTFHAVSTAEEGSSSLGEHAVVELSKHLLDRASAKVRAKHLQWSPFVKPLLRLAQPSARPLRIADCLRERRYLRARAEITTSLMSLSSTPEAKTKLVIVSTGTPASTLSRSSRSDVSNPPGVLN
jgi:hypothetical protein